MDRNTTDTPANGSGNGRGWLKSLRSDFPASLVVFMVALPLCIAIAEASGLPPEAGIITGIIGGLVVGLFSGSQLQVSGPAAGLIVLVLEFVQHRRHLFDQGLSPASPVAALGMALILAGLLQILGGYLRLGQWFRAVSPAVILGMLGGIGVVIVLKQAHVMIDDTPAEKVTRNIRDLPTALQKGLFGESEEAARARAAAEILGGNLVAAPTDPQAAFLIGAVVVLIMVLWKPFAPKRLKIIPGGLLAVAVAIATAELAGLNVKRVHIEGSLLTAIHLPDPANLGLLLDPAIIGFALAITLIASAETLLCASAVDRMHTGPRTQYDRELAAQGVGNTLCGLVGALPMTGVIVRSSANVEAGATSRLSTILHGLWLLIFVSFLDSVLELIPLAALAGILIYTGLKLVNVAAARRLARESRGEAIIFVVTLVTIVVTDLLTGVITGIVLAALKLAYTFSHLSIRREDGPAEGEVVLHLEGSATFLRLPEMAKALEAVPPAATLHVHFEGLTYIDHACLQLLMSWRQQHECTGGCLAIDWESLHARFREPILTNGHGPRTNGAEANGEALVGAGR